MTMLSNSPTATVLVCIDPLQSAARAFRETLDYDPAFNLGQIGHGRFIAQTVGPELFVYHHRHKPVAVIFDSNPFATLMRLTADTGRRKAYASQYWNLQNEMLRETPVYRSDVVVVVIGFDPHDLNLGPRAECMRDAAAEAAQHERRPQIMNASGRASAARENGYAFRCVIAAAVAQLPALRPVFTDPAGPTATTLPH